MFGQLGLSKLPQSPEIIFGLFNMHTLGITFSIEATEKRELETARGESDSEVVSLVTRLSSETTGTLSWEVPRDSLLTRQALPVEKIILTWLLQQLGYPNECITPSLGKCLETHCYEEDSHEIQGWH